MLTILRAGAIIDGDDRLAISDPEIHVRGNRITYVGSAAEAPAESDREVARHDLGSATLMPGMIDSHAHPVLSSPPEGDSVGMTSTGIIATNEFRQEVGRDELFAVGAVPQLHRSLLSGITTFRDCGAARETAYALKKAVALNLIPGPRLVIAGPIICPTGGHGYSYGGEVDGADDARRKARLFFKKGSDFIKVTASGGGTAGTARHRGTLTVDELRAIAEEADQHDSYVTAHVHAIEGMRRCVDAGVPMLEHATFVATDGTERIDKDLLLRIRDNDIAVCPTVAVIGRWLEEAGRRVSDMDDAEQVLWTRRSESFKRRLDIVAALNAEGVRVIMGSDGGTSTRSYPAPLDDLAYSMALHVGVGIPTIDVIRSTTSLAADVIGVGSVTGRLAAGKDADIIAVDGDPINDITAMERVSFVMVRGTVAKATVANKSGT